MKSCYSAADGADAGDEVGNVLFLLRESRIRFEAAVAAGLVGAHRSDDDQLLAFDEALSVNRWVATANADGQQLGDFFRDRQKARHRLERAAAIIRVQPGNDNAFAEIGELGANIHYLIAQELRFVNANDFGARR